MDWELDKKEASGDTLKKLNDLCIDYESQRAAIASTKEVLKDLNSKLNDIQSQILSYFEHYDMTQHRGSWGTLSVSKRFSAKTPKTPEAKEAFYGYLKEQGHFDDLISVNSKTLQSYIKSQMDVLDDPSWKPPGIDEIGYVETISMRKK